MIYEGTREMWTSGSLDKHIGRVKDAMKTEGPGMLASTWLRGVAKYLRYFVGCVRQCRMW